MQTISRTILQPLSKLHQSRGALHFPALPDNSENFTAVVSFVDPRIDAASGLFRVKLLLDNPDHEIKAGMRGFAEFPVQS